MTDITSTSVASDESLEGRIQWLEDVEDVRQLKSRFAKDFDRTLNSGGAFPQRSLLNYFAEDAVWESELFGRYQGHDEIWEFLGQYRKRVSFALDYSVGHLIEISADRQSASGFWTTWQPLTIDGNAHILAGRYHDSYAQISGEWTFTHVKLDVEFLTPYDQGWSNEKVPAGWQW